jgi:hypothetical protein
LTTPADVLQCNQTKGEALKRSGANKKALLDELRRAHLMAAKALEKLIALE